MATTTNILILAAGGHAARLQSWLSGAGAQVAVAPSIDAVLEQVAQRIDAGGDPAQVPDLRGWQWDLLAAGTPPACGRVWYRASGDEPV